MPVLNLKVSGKTAGAIYIGRGSKWGNPYVIGRDGTRDEVCDLYENHLVAQIERGEITWEELAQLYGKDLVCFCAPRRCHGHILEQYINAAVVKKLNESKPVSDRDTLLAIQNLLGGQEWTADTMSNVASLLEAAGYPIEDL